MNILTLALLLGLLQTDSSGWTDKSAVAYTDVQLAVGCLAHQDWVRDDLEELHLKLGDTATVRYAAGSIPGTSWSSPRSLNIVVYSPDGNDAWLFLLRKQGQSFVAVRNAYRLTRSRSGWSAGEGNGGIATYRAVARYVTGLGRRPTLKLRLTASTEDCGAED